MGWTLRKFDRAGRLVEAAHYRGKNKPAPFEANGDRTGSETYAYAGETTTVTDAVGNIRNSTVDALDRLKTASAGGVSAAQYEYDVLDNLKSVTQTDAATFSLSKTQTRSFVFSSLNRLISATNPEADGPTTYTTRCFSGNVHNDRQTAEQQRYPQVSELRRDDRRPKLAASERKNLLGPA